MRNDTGKKYWTHEERVVQKDMTPAEIYQQLESNPATQGKLLSAGSVPTDCL